MVSSEVGSVSTSKSKEFFHCTLHVLVNYTESPYLHKQVSAPAPENTIALSNNNSGLPKTKFIGAALLVI